jgi:hypothetical protein
MRSMFVPAYALGFCLASAPAFAQSQPQEISQPTTTPASTSSPSGTPSKQIICRPVVHQGMVMATQDCRTQAEWDAMRFRHQQELNEVQMRALNTQQH